MTPTQFLWGVYKKTRLSCATHAQRLESSCGARFGHVLCIELANSILGCRPSSGAELSLRWP